MDWFKAWHVGILRGSLSDADDSIQLIWIKLLAIASECKIRNGRLELMPTKPMQRSYLIAVLHTTPEKYDIAIEQFKNDIDANGIPRITIEKDGTIVINNWQFYQTNNRLTKRKPLTEQQKDIIRNKDINKNPDKHRDGLTEFWGDTVIEKNGKVH